MRLSGPVFDALPDADAWVAAHRRQGYTAASVTSTDIDIASYVHAAKAADILIAEVGAWSNPIALDSKVRADAVDHCCKMLAFGDALGARCCVNIAGSRGPVWDGPHPDNLSADTFALIVDTVRNIIDTVQPTRCFYTLETMPWVFPDSPDTYLDLLKAIDRKQFGVHLDPVNIINCPRRAYDTRRFLRECFEKLGPHIKACHAKDIRFSQHLTIHLDECAPGEGLLDYEMYLGELARLDPDIPLSLEHMTTPQEYLAAAHHLRAVAERIGATWR
jgi:sugar phosphate isomerase/epimerase